MPVLRWRPVLLAAIARQYVDNLPHVVYFENAKSGRHRTGVSGDNRVGKPESSRFGEASRDRRNTSNFAR